MGSLGISVKVSGDGDRERARRWAWAKAQWFIRQYLWSDAYQEIVEYLDNADPCVEIYNPGDRLSWIFPDLAGMCFRSQAAWVHWLELWMTLRWSTLEWAIESNGLTVESPAPDNLDELLGSGGGTRFVELTRPETGPYLWRVWEGGLSGDGKGLTLDELTPAELARYEEARDLCRCGMCALIRPDDPDVVDKLIGDLRGDNVHQARTAAQILAHMDIARPDVLLALVTTTPNEHHNDFPERSALVEQYSCYVAEAWPMLRPMLPELTGDDCDMAVVALMPHYENQPAADRAAFLAELEDAAREDGRGSVVAANFLRILRREQAGG